ncbi:MAG: NAD-dependent epimerase/dehydratase family protein [Chloroflexota bacterium]
MQVLIVGGTGLISTAITRELVARGEQVTLYNRGQREPALAPDILAATRRITGDRTDHARFEAQIAAAGPWDCVIDMICFEPAEAESAVRAFRGRAGQYIFCSTVDVYTKPAARYPVHESAERQPRPSFPYAWNKAACERVFEAAQRCGDLNVTMIRPAHTYGPGGRLVHSLGFDTYFFDRVRRGLPLIVHGDGKGLWAACHRDDAGRAFAGAVGNPAAVGKAYHVTGDEWLTWDAYHQGVALAMGAPATELVHISADWLYRAMPKTALWCVENFQYPNIFDNTASKADLGFRYTIPWVEGVGQVPAWLKAHGQIASADDSPWYDQLIALWRQGAANAAAALAPYDQ